MSRTPRTAPKGKGDENQAPILNLAAIFADMPGDGGKETGVEKGGGAAPGEGKANAAPPLAFSIC